MLADDNFRTGVEVTEAVGVDLDSDDGGGGGEGEVDLRVETF